MLDTMLHTPRHTYQLLTKRPSRLVNTGLMEKMTERIEEVTGSPLWPTHLWFGVSIETNEFVWRADVLRRVPAAIRFISAEPLLGPLERLNLDVIQWVIASANPRKVSDNVV